MRREKKIVVGQVRGEEMERRNDSNDKQIKEEEEKESLRSRTGGKQPAGRIICFYFDERVFNFAVPNTPRGVAALQNIHMLRDTHTVAYKM